MTIQRDQFPYSCHQSDDFGRYFRCFTKSPIEIAAVAANGGEISEMNEIAPQTPPPQINEGTAPHNAANVIAEIEMVSDLTQDFMPLASSDATLMPTIYGENRCALARVMAWRPASQKVRISGITASTAPSKKWPLMTHFDAHIGARNLNERLWPFTLNLVPSCD